MAWSVPEPWSDGKIGEAHLTVRHDNFALGSPALSIHDRNSPLEQVLQGLYTALLQSSFNGIIHPATGQVGTIPVDSQSIRFYANGNFSVSFGGQWLPIFALGTGENRLLLGLNPVRFSTNTFNIYGTDIS